MSIGFGASHKSGYELQQPAHSLPLAPLWPGFAINTIFYAGILWGVWLLFTAPGFVRRRMRIKRGLCPACAYPVGSSDVCTECGGSVRPGIVASSPS